MTTDICTIYKITNIKNGLVYVGQTWQKVSIRAGKNGSGYKSQPLFFNAIKKYKWESFKTEIVCYAVSQPEANYWEGHFVRKFDTLNRKKGYNIKEAGSNGKHTEETRVKMSIAKKGKSLSEDHRKKLSIANTGKKHTEEHIKNAADANRGKKRGPSSTECKKKISIATTGENNPSSRLTLEQVRKIRLDTRSQQTIGDEYGVDRSTISLIKRGIHWKEI